MDIINLNKPGESYSIQSWPDSFTVPDGCAVVPEELDRDIFYAHNGFMVLTTTTEEYVTGNHKEPKEVTTTNESGEEITETVYETVDEKTSVTIVTDWAPNLEAWEAWKASQPEPVEPEPSAQDDTDAMMIDHEYRLTLLELRLTE